MIVLHMIHAIYGIQDAYAPSVVAGEHVDGGVQQGKGLLAADALYTYNIHIHVCVYLEE